MNDNEKERKSSNDNTYSKNVSTPLSHREGAGVSPMKYHTASPDRYMLLKAFARENRHNATLAESLLWEELRNKKTGRLYLRQHIIGDYIVDFLCRDDGLIIEVDGGYHSERSQQEDDEIRTRWLENQGYHVIRFTNEEVMYDMENVLEQIDNFFN